MNDISELIEGLKNTPKILYNFYKNVPFKKLKEKRIINRWTIHEHFCHLAQAEEMIYERFFVFKTKTRPSFSAYIPGASVDTSQLINMDIDKELTGFIARRNQTVELVKSFDADLWECEADHQEYSEYGAYIFLRHVLMHDHFHMYRIEELWLTRDEYLK